MYYDRTLTASFSMLIELGGPLRWLFDFVKSHDDLDFQIGKNINKEWISLYRGLTRIISVSPTCDPEVICLNADDKYKGLLPGLYGNRSVYGSFQQEIIDILERVKNNTSFDRYYDNRKEGFYQNELSRRYGICGCEDDEFVIIDKEAVVGYKSEDEKTQLFGLLQQQYKEYQNKISTLDSARYGKGLEKKAIGNELDFLALDRDGNILLIEYKHGTNTSGIYLSPLQIGLYYDIFTRIPQAELNCAVLMMLSQKQQIGLINPKWCKPKSIKNIIPILIISEYPYRSTAKTKFNEIMNLMKNHRGPQYLEHLRTYNFTIETGLSEW